MNWYQRYKKEPSFQLLLEGNVDALLGAFAWEQSPDGHDYWQQIHKSGHLPDEARRKLMGDIRYGPFRKGDRVQVRVDGNYLMGTFDCYHEEDPNLVWVTMDDSRIQNAWEIGRVSLAEREISPEEAVRRGDEQLKLDDPIDNPAHYTTGKIEVIDLIEDKVLGFHLGNVVKYVARAEHKGKALEDLKKARWYLNREIERRENVGGKE